MVSVGRKKKGKKSCEDEKYENKFFCCTSTVSQILLGIQQ